ncbi:Fc receptor-like protein 5 [Thunnus thynnus]|uniref:Fc receptor-like protein 5 n=1 Tax=Thunnus thynnus TaxID=8237 RepID=UPI003528FD34
MSDEVSIFILVLNTLFYGHSEGQGDDPAGDTDDDVILESPEFTLFEGDSVTLRCRHRTLGYEEEATFYRNGSSLETYTNYQPRRISDTTVEMTIYPVSVSDRGFYKCKFDEGTESKEKELKVEARRRNITLRADRNIIPVQESVTLTCNVEDSTGWKYYWYRRTSKNSQVTRPQTAETDESDSISISHGGIYTCRGRRTEPDVSTPGSDEVTIEETVPNKATVILQPNWPLIYRGETVTVRCEIQGGGDTKWTYEWTPANLITSPTLSEHRINSNNYYSGEFKCRGRKDSYSLTEWSDVIKLTVKPYKPKAKLSADNRDIPVGGSVTLTCSVDPSSSGWKYDWYKDEKTSEPLNTQDAVFQTTGQMTVSQGGLYWCRGGRGDPVYYTEYSDSITINKYDAPVLTVSPSWLSPGDSVTLSCEVEHPSAGWRFYWYKTVPKLSDNSYIYELLPDVHSAVTLKVSPDRVQHFIYDSVSLSCEGNSTEWRVMRFSEDHYWSYCPNLRSMTGSTCNIKSSQQRDAVYWCESGSGEFSNAVNITIQNAGIILVSPVHPVTEGDSVTLGCKLRRGELLSNVVFYQNDKLIQNDIRGELNISAVSKSDEGFYTCKYSGKESVQSWMSVKAVSRPDSSSSLIPLIVGLVCGIILIILLLLLYRYRRSKDSHFIRPIQSESTNQNENSSSLHVDACLYESVRGSEDTDNGTVYTF